MSCVAPGAAVAFRNIVVSANAMQSGAARGDYLLQLRNVCK
jgi:hypothetical protein